ncbi:MAG: nitroreductase family protein [Pseudomonadota bacterium]
MSELKTALERRFGDVGDVDEEADVLTALASRGSCRWFEDKAVETTLLRTLCAAALAAPSKSDLQQRDLIILEDAEQRDRIMALCGPQAWIAGAPALIVVCGDNRRLRQMFAMRGRDFANDHLDAFFNAAVDAGIALSALVTAAEAIGLGACPISTIRNEAAEASRLLNLPDHVFPVAAVAIGWPLYPSPRISKRLPLAATVHIDRFSEEGIDDRIADYDQARGDVAPAERQRSVDQFGQAERYLWSDDKTRQFALPERSDFGAFIRAKGFRLD